MNNPKRIKLIYWIFTGLFAAFTLLTSISQLISDDKSVEIMHVLKFPTYLLPLLGAVKLLGLVAILFPVFPKLKEWAYAGFIFDYLGALYAMISVGGTIDKWGFMFIPILLCLGSYFYNYKIIKIQAAQQKVRIEYS